MSLRSTALAAAATLTIAGAVGAATGVAGAATPACGPGCISVFSSELGTFAQPNFVEAVLDGGAATVGRPVGLKAASSLDTALDILPVPGTVSDFYAKGLVSEEANRHYGGLNAVQQRYAPLGMPTELCVGVAQLEQNEVLSLQPCNGPATVWIPHTGLASADGYFPIINASSTDVRRPFAMHLPRDDVASGRPIEMVARRLQFRGDDRTLRARQLWGAVFGVLE